LIFARLAAEMPARCYVRAFALMKHSAPIAILLAAVGLCWAQPAAAGFRTPQSLVQNLYAYYGEGSPDFSHGLPRDETTARRFFQPALARAWMDDGPRPFDFVVQATSWKIGAVAITGTIKQFDRTYVRIAFVNQDKPVALNIVIVRDDDGWLIGDIESTQDSLTSFLGRLRNARSRGKPLPAK
jgi:hypothetical protein